MKKLNALIILILVTGYSYSQASFNIDLLSNKDQHRYGGIPSGYFYSSVWGWTAPNGREYAVIGYWNGTAIYDITDAPNVVQCDTIAGNTSYYNYREFATVGHYLYAVSEGTGTGKGLQVIDLQYLPDSAHHVTTWLFSGFNRAHTIKSSGNYLYINGGDYNQGGVFVVDVTNPEAPVKRGEWGGSASNYVHDCFVRGDTIYGANIQYPNRFSIINASNKDNLTTINQFVYPQGVSHLVWVNDNKTFLVTSDEGGNSHARIWNCSDLSNITFVYEYVPYQTPAMIHNAYFKGDLIFMAHYQAGAVVLDCANLPAAPTVKGYYDTYPAAPNTDYFKGAWNIYPYFSSGKFILSDMQTGLYVFKFSDANGIHSNGNEIPKTFSLEQNYPNPFNPQTKINFDVPKAGNVNLSVYDMNGKLVETIYNGYQLSGKFTADFVASDLSSGVYYYRLSADGFSQTKKMVLAK